MIKANELRIGNYIKGSEGSGFIQIENIDDVGINVFVTGGGYYGGVDREYDAVYEGNYYCKSIIEPIHLSGELLLKNCGFVHHGTIKEKIWCDNDWGIQETYNYRDDFYIYHYPQTNSFKHSGTNKSLESLHQLQNFFFALTNQELDIKLND